MSTNKSSHRQVYRKAFKNGEDVWYTSRFVDGQPKVWTKVDKNHVWKENKYWYAFTWERWELNKDKIAEFCKTHILLPSGRWAKK